MNKHEQTHLNQTVFPLDELPPEIFLVIMDYLSNPIGQKQGKHKAIKALFITTKVIRERYMSEFMRRLWFQLNSNRRLSGGIESLVENLYRPPIIEGFLGRFPNVKRMDVVVDCRHDSKLLPPNIEQLDIRVDEGPHIVDLGHLDKLKQLEVYSPYGFLARHKSLLKIGSPELQRLNIVGAELISAVDLTKLQSLRMESTAIGMELRLFNSLKDIEVSRCAFSRVSGGKLLFARVGEEGTRKVPYGETMSGELSYMHGKKRLRGIGEEEKETLEWWQKINQS